MGPRSAERGSATSHVARQLRTQMLQWGHVRLNVEVLDCPMRNPVQAMASMGPRSAERGSARCLAAAVDRLQWGHVRLNVEVPASTLAKLRA